MTLKELKKTKEELNNKRNELLKISEREINNAVKCQNNQFDTMITMRLAFSAFSYVGMIIIALITKGVLTRLGMADILLNIPKLLVIPATFIPSGLIGTYIDKRLTKNKRTNEFANMTEEERVEKEIRHKIESAKSYSRAEVIKETISDIEEKEKFISTNGEFYGVQTNNVDVEETKEKAQNLITALDSNIKKLDILSTQSVLAENFKEERLKGYDKEKVLISSLGYGILATMYTLMPFIALDIPFSGIAGTITFFGIYGINAAIFGGYCNYRIKMNRRVFKKLNNELGENALTEISENVIKDGNAITREKEKVMNTASTTLGLLQEQRSLLEYIKEEKRENVNKNHHLHRPLSPSYSVDGKYSTFCKFDDLAGIVTSLGGKQYSIKDSCYIPVEELHPEEIDLMYETTPDDKGPTLVKGNHR